MNMLAAVLFAHLGLLATFTVPSIDYTAILPELILLGGALLLVGAASVTVKAPHPATWPALTVGLTLASLVASIVLWHDVTARGPFTAVAGAVTVDGFSVLFLILVSVALILTVGFGEGYLRREEIHGPEFYVLAMLSASGAMLMAAAGDLIIVFLGLEILSIALYVLAGLDWRRGASAEAAMKYFVLGAFSSAIFVYGIALTYGATGSTNLAQIAGYLANNPNPTNGLLLAGMGLLLVGFFFKVAAVPFHMWTPDVYQGSPTPVTGFMAAVAKAGGFAALLRVFLDSFPTLRSSWQPIIWVVAALTLLGGAIVALVQQDIKRMLAYSSINHAGFVLLGLQAATQNGLEGALYYLFTYSVIVVGTFGLVAHIGRKGEQGNDIESYRGLARRNPLVALSLTILLMAQAGIPFTTGFLAKFYVLTAAVSAHSYALAVIAMVSAAVAAFFYLRVIAAMYIGGAGAGVTAPGLALAGAGAGGGPLVRVLAGDDEPDLTLVGAFAVGAGTTAGGGASRGLQAADGSDEREAPGAESEPAAAPAVAAAAVESDDARRVILPPAARVATALCVGVTLVFGVWPQPLFDFAHAATLIFPVL
jgi:NADH-quinone oxidoreductase subunit N